MSPEAYAEYLNSEEWNELRLTELRKAKFRCQVCNTKRTVLQVHHRTYERLGCEAPGDLVVLCKDCHYTFHSSGKLAEPPRHAELERRASKG